MKIILAPDSFKGNLSSAQVATALEKGIQRVLPRANCIKLPMADGGEGTTEALVNAAGGRYVRTTVTDPMGNPVSARYGLIQDGAVAVIEMAEASGLAYVEGEHKDPSKTTSFGTGELIAHALSRNVEQIIIGVGGSATVDGGMGMAQALGVRFFSRSGREITAYGCGKLLGKIASIDIANKHPGLKTTPIIVACDVDTPLFGRHGAAYVFAPQKGAKPAMVKQLDSHLRHYDRVLQRELGKAVSKRAGAGAAGGLGAGLLAFTRARLKSGVEIVLEATEMKRYLRKADLVITGEGRVDFQTAFGKTPAGVAKLAKKFKVPTVAIGGSLADDAIGVFAHGIGGLASACARDMTLEEAIAHSKAHIANAAERVMRLIIMGKKMR